MSNEPTPENPYASQPAENPPAKQPPGSFASPEETINVSAEEKQWAMLSHMSALLAFVVPPGEIVAPLIIYLVYKDKSKYVSYHALQSLLFQLMVMAGIVVGVVIGFLTCIGFVIPIAILMGGAIYPVVVGLKAQQGSLEEYWLMGEFAKQQVGVDETTFAGDAQSPDKPA